MCLIAGYIDVTYFVSFQRTFYFFPFFMLGHCLAIDKKDIKKYCMSLKLSLMILITALVGFIGICGVDGVTFKQLLYGAYIYDTSLDMFYPMLVRLSIILMSYIISLSFLSVCMHIKEKQWLQKIGKSTLFFYIYHTLILTVLKKVFFVLDIPNSLFFIVLYTLIIVVTLYKFSSNIYLIKLLNPITAKK
jgi:fucose 4-O-acetylase-like acetyltransferase